MLTTYSLKPKDELKIKIIHCLKNLIDLDSILSEHGLQEKNQ